MAQYPPSVGRGRGNSHPYSYAPYDAPRGRAGRFQPTRGRGRGAAGPSYPSAGVQPQPEVHATFEINGLSFELVTGGSKLNRLTPMDGHPETPLQHEIAGIKFYRTKGGNLLRYKEYMELQEKLQHKPKKSTEPCARFSQTGQCTRDCLFVHDYDKVSACKSYLMKHFCAAGADHCSLSHDLIPERTPMCIYFAKGNCTNRDCQYAHVTPEPGAAVCTAFGKYGYCGVGRACPDKHVYECPDYANTGHCPNSTCRLPHVERARQLRKQAGATNGNDSNDTSDIDDAQEGSDDMVAPSLSGHDDQSNSAFSQQADFVQL